MADDQLIARDVVIRQAAFDHIRGMQRRDLILSHEDIARVAARGLDRHG
jgi:hypothetical protein